MSNQYGPWATSINACGNPQLSSFWRRRLTMLVPTSRTSPTLSRRNLLWLGMAGVLVGVLPTFYASPTQAEEEKLPGIRKEITPSSAPERNSPSRGRESSEQPDNRNQRTNTEKASPASQAAQRTYEATVEAYQTNRADIEVVYRWSCRWMQADRVDRGDAAIKSHLDRMEAICNKVTKLHETFYIGTAGEVQIRLAKASLKGEFVVLIAPLDFTL